MSYYDNDDFSDTDLLQEDGYCNETVDRNGEDNNEEEE